MKKEIDKKSSKTKRVLPLLASVALLSGPVLLAVGCNHEITRYPAALSNNEQYRILFDFVGVNYNVNAKSQFSAAFKQQMDFIKKDVEGIMAQQEFYNIFVEKLHYDKKTADNTFIQLKDYLGINLLAADYFKTISDDDDFDTKVYASNLIFQTENWHKLGTTRFNYNESAFYKLPENNPDKIFIPSFLYSNLDKPEVDAQIQKIAKWADENYNKEIINLTKGHTTYSNDAGPINPPQLEGTTQTDIETYQKKLERFKWWLRFRYQQYYNSSILPQLNETLFTMANIFNSVLRITDNENKTPKVQVDNSKYAIQLQDWGTNSAWKTNYRWVWDYTINKDEAAAKDIDWNNNPLPDLIKQDTPQDSPTLNINFLNQMISNFENPLRDNLDPILGINSFINNTSGKSYADAVKANNLSGWANNGDGHHYWGTATKGTFAYSAPVYWIDVVLNLNFNYYQNPNKANEIIINEQDNYKGLISAWRSNRENSSTSSSKFSQFIRADNITSANYDYFQKMKWNTLWQMIYFLAAQTDANPNKEVAKDNFITAAKALYPKYIKKENIYNDEFWRAINAYY